MSINIVNIKNKFLSAFKNTFIKNKKLVLLVAGAIGLFMAIVIFHIIQYFLIQYFFKNYEPPPVTISSIIVKKHAWHSQIEAVGNFVAKNGVEVNSQASGEVTAIHFKSGQNIHAGQLLIDIDDNIEQAVLKSTQAQLKLKKISYARQVDLYKRGVAAISSVDEALASLEQAKSNLEKTEAEIRHKHIIAPFAGKLGIRQINLGQYITPGKTSIVSLQELNPLYLEFYLPEHLYKKIHVGQLLKFNIEELPQRVFTAKIYAINAKVDTNTHNILVQAILPNDPVIFIPGMFAYITVIENKVHEGIIIPSTAISYSLYGNSVFLIEKANKGMLRVRRVFIQTGEQQGNFTVVTKGLHPGEMIVSIGELKLHSGTVVTINNSIKLHEVTSDQLQQ